MPAGAARTLPLDERKIIARRAALELKANSVVNLGIGMPEGISAVAAEERIGDLLTLTAEPGVIGGLPASGLDFGAAINTQAVIDQPYQFDFYDGGGLDVAFLGLAQADARGNLNVSRFGPRFAGAGGFINISQSAKKVVFVGSFTAGGLEVGIDGGRLSIRREGGCAQVRRRGRARDLQRTRSRASAASRCCTSPSAAYSGSASDGLELIEIAPGIDLERDILAHMSFRPRIAPDLALMDAAIFDPEPMALRQRMLRRPLAGRFAFDPKQDTFFANFEGLTVRDAGDVEALRAALEGQLVTLGHKVQAMVDYDNFVVAPEALDAYTDMIHDVATRHYTRVTRYTTSAFLRAKLGEALYQRGVAPHIFESAAEARAHLATL